MVYETRLAEFEDYLINRVSTGTVRVYMYALRQWFASLNGNPPSKYHAQKYVDGMLANGKAASTVSMRAHAIMRWFKWRGNKISLDCPTIRLNPPKYLSLFQIELLLAHCDTVLEEVLVTVLFDTAVRISELLELQVDDIDYGTKLISVTRKGGRKEEVNISDKGLIVLDKWIEARTVQSKRVFMDLTYTDAWNIIRVLGKRVGIDLHPHMLRHSRAVQMRKAGASLEDIKEHLGHLSITTTANIYSRFKAQDLKERIPEW